MRVAICLAWSIGLFSVPALAENWPQWRGPALNGVSGEKDLPVRSSTTENVAWKLAMPSKTGSTPIIWGNNIFLIVAEGDSLYLWCVDKTKGTPIWKKLVAGGNFKINKHNMSTPSPVTDGKLPTPVTDGTYFYSVNDRGIVWCLDAKTGQEVYGGQRIRTGTYSSSPVLTDGKIYATSEDGVTTVFRAGPKFEVLAENDLAGYTLSSPAVSDGHIFTRTTQFLYSIGKP